MTDWRHVAAELRRKPPRLDDLRRARMERQILERSSSKPTRRKSAPARRAFAAGVSVGLAAAAVAGLVFSSTGPRSTHPTLIASLESLQPGAPTRQGTLDPGETLETRAGELLRVTIGASQDDPRALVAVRPRSRLRVDSLDATSIELSLERGRARFEFHPKRRGHESFRVRTPGALVEVIGTVFEVAVGSRPTRVTVIEGVVRVTSLATGASARVRAGQSHLVATEPSARGFEVRERRRSASSTDGSARPHDREGETTAPIQRAGDGTEGHLAPASGSRARSAERPSQPPGAQRRDARRRQPTESSDTRRAPAPAPPLADDVRFELAARYFEQERLEEARHELYAIARTTPECGNEARAWVEIAETFERQRAYPQAAEAYRRAAAAGEATTFGTNALFALGRLRERMGDRRAAQAAYRRYIEQAPEGPLAPPAMRALCRLGDRRWCQARASGPP